MKYRKLFRIITTLTLVMAMALSCGIASFADEEPVPEEEIAPEEKIVQEEEIVPEEEFVPEEVLSENNPPLQNTGHVHSWTYTASVDTITASCAGNGECTYSGDDLSLTISASSGGYNGLSREADFGDAVSFCGGELPEISYGYNAEAAGSYAPVSDTKNVGFYKASFTAGSGDNAKTAYVEYSISRTQLIAQGFSPNSKVYDGTTAATVTPGNIIGTVEGDDVSVNAVGSFSDPAPGISKGVNITFELSGSDASNYSVPESVSSEADITAGSYSVYAGGNGSWTKSSGKDHTITIKRNPADDKCFSFFKSIEIDGKALTNGTDYSAKSGSTVITLKAAALQKLGTGTHSITVSFDDGTVSTNLTVKAANGTPNTGDGNNPSLLIVLCGCCAAGLGGITAYYSTHKRRRNK